MDGTVRVSEASKGAPKEVNFCIFTASPPLPPPPPPVDESLQHHGPPAGHHTMKSQIYGRQNTVPDWVPGNFLEKGNDGSNQTQT